jgi:hypothetical protein
MGGSVMDLGSELMGLLIKVTIWSPSACRKHGEFTLSAKTCRSDFCSIAVVQFKDRSKPIIQLKPPISSV